MDELSSVVVHRASRLFCAFSMFLDAVLSSILLPHTCFLLSCMHSMVETKNMSKKIYTKNSSTCRKLLY
jgi:hypothetical protein